MEWRQDCCGSTKVRLRDKLGRCRRCMSLTAAVTLAAWAAVPIAHATGPRYALVGTLAAAVGITTLGAAHLAAYAGRRLSAGRLQAVGEPGMAPRSGRRAFLASMLRGAAALLLLPLARPSRARAQGEPTCRCELKIKRIKLVGITNNQAFFFVEHEKAECAGDCGGDSHLRCDPKIVCEWTCNNRDLKHATCHKAAECFFIVQLEKCPATVKLKVKSTLTCHCDRVQIGPACTDEKEGTFEIECCRCLEPNFKGDGIRFVVAGSTETIWTTLDQNKDMIVPRCSTCSATNASCNVEDKGCEWSVEPGPGHTASIAEGGNTSCDGVTVSHSEGASYTLSLHLVWRCRPCGELDTVCFRDFTWSVTPKGAKLQKPKK